ncbi:hypothetical protein BN14_12199 [Rhizoctonia solani AG-1 IB]|uniref:Uncharacterized protein n=1 Tax=Thanatephorus cucumeris (strain AG1-IB / isolate 7/3/14) TaxID=1108050 RepID=M5CF18_THACB|nr:hypothetical protein BN14_12199 [Rhizoctonia solani AG-1 IB]
MHLTFASIPGVSTVVTRAISLPSLSERAARVQVKRSICAAEAHSLQQFTRIRSGRFTASNSPATSTPARGRRVFTQPDNTIRRPTPRSPALRHTPIPGLHDSNLARPVEPSLLSFPSPLPVESPESVGSDLPSDLKDFLDQTQSTLRPGTPSPTGVEPLGFKSEPSSPTIPKGPAPSPLGYAATSAMVVQSSEAAAKASAIKSLNALGEFEGDGRLRNEAEYRLKFKYITSDCADEVKAELWHMNLAYGGPAFYWYHELIESAEGREAAKKWSTLEPEIEKRWSTPPINVKAFKKRTRNEWEARTFDIESMLDELRNPALGTKPHFEWATYHKLLGLRVKTGDAERVANTL